MNASSSLPLEEMIHAAQDAGPHPNFVCGGVTGRVTRPKEWPTCSECLAALKYTADRYPERFDFQDIRMTTEERRQSALSFAADMMGGADD